MHGTNNHICTSITGWGSCMQAAQKKAQAEEAARRKAEEDRKTALRAQQLKVSFLLRLSGGQRHTELKYSSGCWGALR